MFRLAFDVLCIYMNWDCISTELKRTSLCYIYRRGSWGQGAQSRSTRAQIYEICKTYNDSIEHGLHAGTHHLVRNCEEFMKCVKNIIDMCQNMLQTLKWVIMKKLSVPIKLKMRHLILWQLIVEKSHCFYDKVVCAPSYLHSDSMADVKEGLSLSPPDSQPLRKQLN